MANMKDWLWPSIDDLDDAKKAAHLGAGVAFVVAVVTGAVAAMSMAGVKLLQNLANAYSFIDAGLFLIIGFFIYRFSRIAALAGLLLYVGEQIVMMKTTGFRFSIIPIFFTLHFIAGVRGTFDYHHMKKLEKTEAAPQTPPQIFPQAQEVTSKKFPLRLMAVVLIFVALAGAGAWYFLIHSKTSLPSSSAGGQVLENIEDEAPAVSHESIPAVSLGQNTFKLKDGKSVTGRVIMEDDVYYTVETSGGKQEIVFKEDLS